MRHKLTTILAAALALAACGVADDAGDPTTATAGPDTTTAGRRADEVVLRVRSEGGFAPVELIYNPLPRYTLLGDGRLVFEGPAPAVFPGPLIPSVQVAHLAEGNIARILELVAAAGLPEVTDEVNNEYTNRVADAPHTVVTYHDAAGQHRFSVYALGMGLDPPGDPRVAALQRLVEALDAVAASASGVEPLEVGALQIVVTDSFGAEKEAEAVVALWPLEAPVAELAEPVLGELRCITLEGAEARTAAAAFGDAHGLTFFDDGAGIHRLVVRPIVPGETGCPAN